MRGRIEAAHGERWTVTELLDIRDVLLDEFKRFPIRVKCDHVLLMLGDVYRDLVAVCGRKGAALAMAQRDQENGRCQEATS